jgi:18S rRNA (guanine1575-N7)-methyltransferase
MASKRPEQVAPADIFYNEAEARKYAQNTRMISIQRELTERAIEILAIPEGKPRMLLDIGAGTGISGGVLSEYAHMWVGTDISKGMLNVAAENPENEGDLVHADMGHGFGFRPGTFDGAISISALQWLCSAE